MRQIWVKTPEGKGQQILDLAKKHDGVNLISFNAHDCDEQLDVVVMNVANYCVSDVIQDLDSMDKIEITLFPQDVYPFTPPNSQVPNEITHVTQRSPVEIWLNGLQSIGSWKGFIGYAVAASIIVWIGMYANTVYLLVAAMLVAPFAGPAMNFALATSTGDSKLLWRNLLRYFTSLGVTILVSFLLSLVFQQQIATGMMVQVSEISAISVLLPLTAGAVGALNLSQATNNSLVPGAAVGTLIAASLAPPAGLVGMAAAIGRWDFALSGVFLLLLQLFGINFGGSLVFRYFHLSPQGARFKRGKTYLFYVSLISSVLLLAGMVVWQFSSSPQFQRSTQSQKAAAVVKQLINDYPAADPVEIDMRFTRASVQGQNTLLGVIYVQRHSGASQSDEQIRQALTQQIQQQLLQKGFKVQPLISVTVLDPP